MKKEWGEETPEQHRSRSRSVSITEADLLTYPRWHFLSAALHIPALLTHSCCESVPPSASDPPQTYLPAQHHVLCTPAWGETDTGTHLKACARVSYRLVLRKLVPAKTLFSSFLIWLFKAPTRTLQQWLWLTYSLSIIKNLTWKSPQKQTNSENSGKGSAFFINSMGRRVKCPEAISTSLPLCAHFPFSSLLPFTAMFLEAKCSYICKMFCWSPSHLEHVMSKNQTVKRCQTLKMENRTKKRNCYITEGKKRWIRNYCVTKLTVQEGDQTSYTPWWT